MAKKKHLGKYKEQLNIVNLPVVGLKWLEECILSSQYFEPSQFDLMPDREVLKANSKPKRKKRIDEQLVIDNFMNKRDSSDRRFNFLSGIIVSSMNFSKSEQRFIEMMVAICGGMYFKKLNFMCTHIICDYYSSGQEVEWSNTVSDAKIISLDWLI